MSIPRTILEYGHSPGFRRFLTLRRTIVAVASLGGLILLSAGLSVAVRTDLAWACAICRSQKSQTEWIFGLSTRPVIRQSALDHWTSRHQGGHTHDWRNVKGTLRNLFGFGVGSDHGGAPPIAQCPFEFLEVFVHVATDEQIGAFVTVMTNGSEAEQEAAVQRTADFVFPRWEQLLRDTGSLAPATAPTSVPSPSSGSAS